jgi:ornithine cyclodeaminase
MHQNTITEFIVVGPADVFRILTMASCIEGMEHVMRRVSQGKTQLPLRNVISLPGGGGNFFAAMPGCIEEPVAVGAKLAAIFPRNAERGLSSHNGVVVLLDPDTGLLAAVIDASAITAIRTAAATAVATRALARPESGMLAIIGAGEQAVTHLEALAQVLPLRNVRVWARSADKARAFAESEGARHGLNIEMSPSVQLAVEDADVVCTVTGSKEPILRGEWLAPGTHVNLVGASVMTSREADDEVVRRGRFYVDYRPSALAQAGELRHARDAGVVTDAHLLGEIGEVLEGKLAGRANAADITIYKSLGIAAQDLAAAQIILERARRESLGTRVAF